MGPILFVIFIVVPLIELWIIIQVGQVVGAGWTVAALLLVSLAGAALVKREGLRAWERFRRALAEGRAPAREVVDGALLLLGGALLLTPGFLTDAIGLLLLVPMTRAGVNHVLRSRVRAFVGLGPPRRHSGRRGRPDDRVVDVEVLRVERDGDGRPSDGLSRDPGQDQA